ncbi:MAG TPA: hypothetical protein VGI40_05065 [Pirellulaceae bacterium]
MKAKPCHPFAIASRSAADAAAGPSSLHVPSACLAAVGVIT